ncbi:MAG TPA: hypothetical protein PKC43_14910 [Phycisphaerales bacterium]|nr:hypothetical protein [Phycisphaerales bacterium]HMP38724.1 hypothetical protein [Phycisphaerales bacterium]
MLGAPRVEIPANVASGSLSTTSLDQPRHHLYDEISIEDALRLIWSGFGHLWGASPDSVLVTLERSADAPELGLVTLFSNAEVDSAGGGSAAAPSPPAPRAGGTYIIAASTHAALVDHDVNAPKPSFGQASTTFDVVAIEFTSPSETARAFVGLRAVTVVDAFLPLEGWIAASVEYFLPLEAWASLGEATQFVERIGSLLGDSADPPDYGGFDPATCDSAGWVSPTGFPCCTLWDNYRDARTACWTNAVYDAIFRCLGPGVGATLALTFGCGLAFPPAVPLCLIGGLLGAGVVYVGCVGGYFLSLRGCYAGARASYRADLVNNGCWPAPPLFAP